MDINDLRSLVTVIGFALFLALVVRVWRRQALPSHQAAAQLVFEGERDHATDMNKEVRHG